MKLLLLLLFAAGISNAQLSQKTWTALTATGTTSGFNVPASDIHTISAIVTGAPSGCTMHLEGSLDNTNWFDISGDQTCTSSLMFHVVNRSVALVRVNLTALTGGTAPTVTASYLGHSSGSQK